MFAINMGNFKKLKYHISEKKTLSLCVVYSKCNHGYEKYLKKKNQLKY